MNQPDIHGKATVFAEINQFRAPYLAEEPNRPLRAHVSADDAGSIRVLEKCGFVETGKGTWFAQARGREIEEIVMSLD